MKELKTYRDLFQAILDGHEIEFWDGDSNDWITTLPTHTLLFSKRILDKPISPNTYRLKQTKPSNVIVISLRA